jgi:RNA polymerase sigma-70 factor, ECF subfamily
MTNLEFEAIYARYDGIVKRTVRGVLRGRPHLAEEAAQIAWIEISRTLDPTRKPEEVQGFIITVARHTAIDCARADRRDAQTFTSLEQMATTEDGDPTGFEPASPSPMLDMSLTWRVRECVAALPDRMRSVVALAYFADMNDAQIAAKLGITAKTVRNTLAEARSRLKEMLSESGTSTAKGGHYNLEGHSSPSSHNPTEFRSSAAAVPCHRSPGPDEKERSRASVTPPAEAHPKNDEEAA